MIRKMETKDLDRVMQIWLNGNVDAHNFLPKSYWLGHYSSVKKALLDAEVYVYEEDKKIQGFVGMLGDYLAGIFVDKNCRSMGIGKKLLDHIKKIHPFFSLNVYRQNSRAVHFYLREGLLVAAEGIDEDTAEADYTMSWNGHS